MYTQINFSVKQLKELLKNGKIITKPRTIGLLPTMSQYQYEETARLQHVTCYTQYKEKSKAPVLVNFFTNEKYWEGTKNIYKFLLSSNYGGGTLEDKMNHLANLLMLDAFGVDWRFSTQILQSLNIFTEIPYLHARIACPVGNVIIQDCENRDYSLKELRAGYGIEPKSPMTYSVVSGKKLKRWKLVPTKSSWPRIPRDITFKKNFTHFKTEYLKPISLTEEIFSDLCAILYYPKNNNLIIILVSFSGLYKKVVRLSDIDKKLKLDIKHYRSFEEENRYNEYESYSQEYFHPRKLTNLLSTSPLYPVVRTHTKENPCCGICGIDSDYQWVTKKFQVKVGICIECMFRRDRFGEHRDRKKLLTSVMKMFYHDSTEGLMQCIDANAYDYSTRECDDFDELGYDESETHRWAQLTDDIIASHRYNYSLKQEYTVSISEFNYKKTFRKESDDSRLAYLISLGL